MKRIFLTILAAISLVSFVACKEKVDPENKPDDNNGGNETTEAIAIDGSFADWAALKNAVSVSLGEDNAYPGLLAMKAYADETNIYIYFEYELQEIDEDGNIQTIAPFEIFVNSDDNSATGGASWLWADPGYEYMLECETGFLEDGNVRDMDDMNIYLFDGVDGVDAWGEGGHLTQQEVTAFCESAGDVKSGVATVEVSFLRSVVNANKAGNCTLGIVAYNDAWGTTGVLPQGAAAGEVGMLEVTLP